MGWIITGIVGLIVGFIARAIMPGEQKMGVLLTAILGIVGAMVASVIGTATGLYTPNGGAGWIASVVGALLVLFVYGKVTAASKKPQA
jgi:uncharacterized membrane protein YeaQ/YmgE (transglycosylase-associated protein family)